MYSNKFPRSNGFTITHREYICDVVQQQQGQFSYAAYPLNPGLTAVFPWLSGAAGLFEQYKFQKMCFHYISTSADALNSVNTALGTVILSCDYNAANPPFTSKIQMENSMLTISGKPSQDIAMPVDCHSKQSPLQGRYVRSGGVGLNQDIRFYDHGLFQIATVGGQVNTGNGVQVDPYSGTTILGNNIGELWVEYTVTFYKPILDNDTASRLAYFHMVNPDSAFATNNDNCTNASKPLGGAVAANYGVNLGLNQGQTQIWCPPASTATNGLKVVHDDFGLFICNDTGVGSGAATNVKNAICFPAGSCGGTLRVTINFFNAALAPDGVAAYFTTPTVYSYYPKTIVTATVGIILVKVLNSSTGAGGSSSYNTPYIAAGGTSSWATHEVFVAITDNTKDNYLALNYANAHYIATSSASAVLVDVMVQQLSGATTTIAQ